MKRRFNYIILLGILSVLLSTSCPDNYGNVEVVVKNVSHSSIRIATKRTTCLLEPNDSIEIGYKSIECFWFYFPLDIAQDPHPKIIAGDGRVFNGDIFDYSLYEKVNTPKHYSKIRRVIYQRWTLTITDDDLVAAE